MVRKKIAKLVSIMLIMLFSVITVSPGFAYAVNEIETGAPVREVHSVGVAGETYCFFVTHNVVLTPAEVAGMTDEELIAAVVDRAGLYMRETNCKKMSHETITAEGWTKRGRSFLLSDPDVAGIRAAQPVDGRPVKFYLDLLLSPDSPKKTEAVTETKSEEKADDEDEAKSGDESKDESIADDESKDEAKADDDIKDEAKAEEDKKEPDSDPEPAPTPAPAPEPEPVYYSTYKAMSPGLLFVEVATEGDAKKGEDICKDVTKQTPVQQPQISIPDVSDDEMLPENRTITMVDRSGAPIEDTLADGDPVTLEWKEPKGIIGKDDDSLLNRFPGGAAALAAAAGAAVIAAALAVAAKKRRKTDD